jgi:ribosomal protein L35
MKQSVRNRIKITKRGKILRRAMGLGHGMAKKSSQQKQRKQRKRQFKQVDVKMIRKYLST